MRKNAHSHFPDLPPNLKQLQVNDFKLFYVFTTEITRTQINLKKLKNR